VHKKNGGLSDARNAGLKVISGEYVYFLDSDDYIMANTIEKALNVMQDRKVDAVVFGYQKIDEDGKIIKDSHFATGMYSFNTEKEKLNYIYKYLLQAKIGWEVWSRLYKVDIIKNNNLIFEPNKEIFAEDRCFNLYYTLCSSSIYCMEERLHYYLVRSSSIMGKQKEWRINEAICLSQNVLDKAKELKQQYIVRHFKYIDICIIGTLVFLMKPEEYGYYAEKVRDRKYCRKSYNRLTSHITFRRIWGIRGGARKRRTYQRFISCL
jgi:glycosyltransferase involved in cell wall biosynthesis